MVSLKRIYELTASDQGYKVLIDGIWPRGIKKETAPVDIWMKDAGVSKTLRKWFNHDPEKWEDFKAAYQNELNKKPEILQKLKSLENEYDTLILVYAAKNKDYNHAWVLKELLDNMSMENK